LPVWQYCADFADWLKLADCMADNAIQRIIRRPAADSIRLLETLNISRLTKIVVDSVPVNACKLL
jgi:hypothetical protein